MQHDDTPRPHETLDDITNRHPETIEVFNRFGIDICCGGAATLEEATRRDGVDLPTLQAALRDALASHGARHA